jgi:hypothetical protein
MVERTIPGNPRPAIAGRGQRTKVLPCHEVADGFYFPASHRKIKKEFALLLLAVLCDLRPLCEIKSFLLDTSSDCDYLLN